VCLPGEPRCGSCPIVKWCSTRGHVASPKKELRRQRTVAYRLALRADAVWLIQRASSERLMAGMWELPPASSAQASRDRNLMRLKHSITSTDYSVTVVRGRA